MSETIQAYRKAIVITNYRYKRKNLPSLEYTSLDSESVSQCLNNLQFETQIYMNLKASRMSASIKDFIDSLSTRDTVFLYFAGNAAHDVDQNNFLLPTDYETGTDLDEKSYLCANTIARLIATKILSGTSIFVFDTCRFGTEIEKMNLMLTPKLKIGLQSFSVSGAIIAYSARDGTPAYETKNHGGLYTYSLLQNIYKKIDVSLIFRYTNATLAKLNDQLGLVQESHYVDGTKVLNPILTNPRSPYSHMSTDNVDFTVMYSQIICRKQPVASLKCFSRGMPNSDYTVVPKGTRLIVLRESGVWYQPVELNTVYIDQRLVSDVTTKSTGGIETEGSFYSSEIRLSKDESRRYKRIYIQPTEIWVLHCDIEKRNQMYLRIKEEHADGTTFECKFYVNPRCVKFIGGYWIKVELPDKSTGYIHSIWIPPDLKQNILPPEILWTE